MLPREPKMTGEKRASDTLRPEFQGNDARARLMSGFNVMHECLTTALRKLTDLHEVPAQASKGISGDDHASRLCRSPVMFGQEKQFKVSHGAKSLRETAVYCAILLRLWETGRVKIRRT
jgi:hypothetical protein